MIAPLSGCFGLIRLRRLTAWLMTRMPFCFAQLPNGVAKARSRAMAALVDGFGDALAHLVGTRQRVVVVERAADGRSLVGHTKCYSQARTPLFHACHSWR